MRRVKSIRALTLASVVTTAASCGQLVGLDRFHEALCVPGEKKKADDCSYSGPAGTNGVGICRSGERTCAEDGQSWGGCSDPVLPRAEDCATPEDDNCDGQVNEVSAGCCEPGAMLSCYSGPEGTEGVGLCQAGAQVCGKDGKAPAACTGDVKPTQETCANPKDEDCDGRDCVEWAEILGDGADQIFVDLAVTSSGEIIASGGFSGSMMLNGEMLTAAGGGDVLIVKTEANGKPLWGRSFGDSGEQHGGVVAVDSTGAVIFSGCTKTTLDIGATTVPPGQFVAKLEPDGQKVSWAKGLHTNTSCDLTGTALTGLSGAVSRIRVTSSNDVLVVGRFEGSIDFGGGPIAAAGGKDAFVALLSGGTGSAQVSDGGWTKIFGDAANQGANDAVVMPITGDVVVVGTFVGSISFGSPSPTLTAQGGDDAFLLRMRYDGTNPKLRAFGGTGQQEAQALAPVDSMGNYVVAGVFDDVIDFGGPSLTTPSGTASLYLVGLDGTDKPKWSRAYGGKDFLGYVYDLAVDPVGSLMLSGIHLGAVDFGGGPLTASNTQFNAFLAKLDGSGNQLWARSLSTPAPFIYGRTRVTSTGETVMAGFVAGPVDFGTGLLTPAGTDAFITKFGL